MLKRLVTGGLALATAALVLAAAPPTKLTGGNGTLYIGGWPNKIFVIDEATEKITGAIDVTTGDPTRMILSKDRKRFYLVNALAEQVEIIDIAARKSVDHFTLSEGRKRVRIRSLIPDPLDRFVILLVKTAEKKIDRFEISPPTLVVYDLKQHTISRTIPWPNNEEREGVNIMMSPDGKLLYFFADDVLIYDTTEFKQVDKWELARPPEEGMGRSTSGRATSRTRSRDSTAASSRFRIRCRTVASWAWPGSISAPSRWTSGRLGRRARWASRSRPIASARTACSVRHRPLRVLDVRSRTPQARRESRVRRPPADGASDQLERQAAVHLSGGQYDRPLRGEHV